MEKEPLYRTSDRPDGKLEVELDGGALVLPLQRVWEGDVDLGTVESPVAGVQLPGQPQ